METLTDYSQRFSAATRQTMSDRLLRDFRVKKNAVNNVLTEKTMANGHVLLTAATWLFYWEWTPVSGRVAAKKTVDSYIEYRIDREGKT